MNDPGHPDLTVGLWYPSNQAVPVGPNTRFCRSAALEAPVGKANGGLILISHGFSGWFAGHADTAEALADAGYIVAALCVYGGAVQIHKPYQTCFKPVGLSDVA